MEEESRAASQIPPAQSGVGSFGQRQQLPKGCGVSSSGWAEVLPEVAVFADTEQHFF